jgi:hypothetical protein
VQGDDAREAILRKQVRSQAPAPGAGG